MTPEKAEDFKPVIVSRHFLWFGKESMNTNQRSNMVDSTNQQSISDIPFAPPLFLIIFFSSDWTRQISSCMWRRILRSCIQNAVGAQAAGDETVREMPTVASGPTRPGLGNGGRHLKNSSISGLSYALSTNRLIMSGLNPATDGNTRRHSFAF
ncbi:hypothetical protein ACRALDRAFT_207655 [Sodiomyces alcalophilus JCM 7366]|uniref:uncharacterized protein n=1 Tax=Sodiomyces alcalophilus JCM 7366 TaxID=591952 RepID=UPI0039B472B9